MTKFVIDQEYVCTECGYEDTADMVESHLVEQHNYTYGSAVKEMNYIIQSAEEESPSMPRWGWPER